MFAALFHCCAVLHVCIFVYTKSESIFSVLSLTANGGLSAFEGSTYTLPVAPPPEYNWQVSGLVIWS